MKVQISRHEVRSWRTHVEELAGIYFLRLNYASEKASVAGYTTVHSIELWVNE